LEIEVFQSSANVRVFNGNNQKHLSGDNSRFFVTSKTHN